MYFPNTAKILGYRVDLRTAELVDHWLNMPLQLYKAPTIVSSDDFNDSRDQASESAALEGP